MLKTFFFNLLANESFVYHEYVEAVIKTVFMFKNKLILINDDEI